MHRPALTVLALLAALSLAAQDQPQLFWEGQVDGISLLRVRGNRVDVEEVTGLPVQRQRFRFFERLPDRRQNVRLEVVEGRGQARIVEQPRADNNYTLSVRIEDRQSGSSLYVLSFYWDSGGPLPGWPDPPLRGRTESLSWNGRVDGEAIVSCHGKECETSATRGAPVIRDRYRFSRPLPARDVTVSLERTEGRGEVRLLEQPRERNGHTARVLIRDPQGGASDYAFTLVWSPPARGDQFDFARRGLIWSGRVDGRVRVIVQGNTTLTEVLSGTPVSAERATFARGLPARNNPDATIRKLRGRGRVEIVAFPSSRNGFRLIFQIDDRAGGADNYEIEVNW